MADMDNIPEKLKKAHEEAEKLRKAAYETPAEEENTDESALSEEVVEEGAPKEESPARAQEEDDWRKRYMDLEKAHSTLKGKYNAEVPNLMRENHQLKQNNTYLQSQLVALQKKPEGETSAKPPAEQQKMPRLDLKAFDDYDDEFKQLARMNNDYADTIERLEQRLNTVESQYKDVTQGVQMTAEQQFWHQFRAAIPDFETIEAMPEFQASMEELEPFTGRKKQELLVAAYNDKDWKRAAVFYQPFSGKEAHVVTSPASKTAALAAQATPGKTRATEPPKQKQAAPIITIEQLKKAQEYVQRGLITQKDFEEKYYRPFHEQTYGPSI